MATIPILLSTGSISGAGTAGQGRNDLDIGETVTLSDTVAANSGASYVWEFVDIPISSTATLTGPTTATPTFVPDVTGSYRVKATVNGVFQSEDIYAVPLANTGSRIPSFSERTTYNGAGNTKGWHEAMTYFMRQVDAGISGGGGGPDIQMLPDLWLLQDVQASQTNLALSCQNSALFDNYKVARAGSVTSLIVRFNGTITAGSATITITKNGTAGTLNLICTSSSNTTGGIVTQSSGDTFAIGDLIGVQITTNGSFTPLTLDLEVAVEVKITP